MTCTWAPPPRRMSRGLRAYQRVNAHVQGFACEQRAEIDTESANVQTHCIKLTDFRLFSPNGSAVWRAHRFTSQPHRHQTGGIALHEAPTRRRHGPRRLRVVQNPHHWLRDRQRFGRFNLIGRIQPDQKGLNLPDRVHTSGQQALSRIRRRRRRSQRPQAAAKPSQTKIARNFPRSLLETIHKRCNCNDVNSWFEVAARELRAKLLRASAH